MKNRKQFINAVWYSMKEAYGMFGLFCKKCYLCNAKVTEVETRIYLDDSNKKIYCCYKCVTYAERRAFRKIV